MNILLITPLFPESSGTSRTETTFAIYNFVKHWKREHRVVVVRPKSASWRNFIAARARRHELDGIEILSIPYFRVSSFDLNFIGRTGRRIARLLRHEGIGVDVIVAHYHVSIQIGAQVARILDKPFAAAFHKRDIVNLQSGKAWMYDEALERAALLVFRSSPIERRFREFYPRLAKPCFIANSGVPGDEVIEEDAFLSKYRSMADKRQWSFIVACSLISNKRVDTTINALARFRARQWTMRVVGDGPERKKLEDLASDLGVADRVMFDGQLSHEQTLEAMRKADIFVMVSERETFGLVYLEAMSAGCLVIGARGWGIDGIVRDGANGFLCDSDAIDGLVDRLNSIATMGPDALSGLGCAAYRTIKEMDESSVAAAYVNRLAALTMTP